MELLLITNTILSGINVLLLLSLLAVAYSLRRLVTDGTMNALLQEHQHQFIDPYNKEPSQGDDKGDGE